MDAVTLAAANAAAKKRYVPQRAAALRTALQSPVTTAATPPTITVDAGQAQANSGTTGTTLTGSPINLPYNSANRWRLTGCVPVLSGAAYYIQSMFAAVTGAVPTFRVDFMHQGAELELILRYTNSGTAGWRLMVDGQWVNTYVAGNGDGLRHFIKVTFPSRATRRIILQIDNLAFGGANIGVNDTVWQAPQDEVRALWLGDSFALGYGADRQGNGLAMLASDRLGWRDVTVNAQSGTGYLWPSTSSKQALKDRIAAHLTNFGQPTIVVIVAGYNDNSQNITTGYSAASVATAATATYAALATQMPGVPVVVMGPQVSGTSSQEALDRSTAVLAAAATAPNVVRSVDTTGWVTGNGRVGATTGNGNADVITSGDGAHPSNEGHDYWATRITQHVRAALASI